MPAPLTVGAVAHAPRVSVIWDIIRDYFEANGCPIDVVLFKDYDLQVDALVEGRIDIAWNSPLAWLQAQGRTGDACRAIAMRDTDRDRVSHVIAARDGGIASIEGLRGTRLAVGAVDSPQATLIPIAFLARGGLTAGADFEVVVHDRLPGLHGDHVGGELEALDAVRSGAAEAFTVQDLNWLQWSRDGTVNPEAFTIVATTPPYDHCVFTTRAGLPSDAEASWLQVLFSMSYDRPEHREMMDLEGLRAWLQGRTSGFGQLAEAIALRPQIA